MSLYTIVQSFDRVAQARPEARTKANWGAVLLRPHGEALRAAFSACCIALDALAILGAATAAPAIYRKGLHATELATDLATNLPSNSLAELGGLMLVLFVSLNLAQGAYGFQALLASRGRIASRLECWSFALMGALAFEFAIKGSNEISRGSTLLFFMGGALALVGTRRLSTRLAALATARWALLARRLLLVGRESDVAAFLHRHSDAARGVEIVNAAVLRGPATIKEDLALAAATARIFRPDDIVILASWTDEEILDACIDALSCIPAALHMGPAQVLERFSDAEIVRIGAISSLKLARRPLNLLEISIKRGVDVMGALFGLALLSPLLLAIAIAIKLDSAGPVLFMQRRYGFNQTPFRVFKFRSLNTLEDDARLTQVTRGDARMTRVGRLLRRTNLDELPQLMNVLRGEMSLVGPRPHALAHDHLFARSIALAARRHNVKPGITGWAQVNGFRGALDTAMMQGRIEHDLYYIDHWSLWLDLRILAQTFSAKAFRNAC